MKLILKIAAGVVLAGLIFWFFQAAFVVAVFSSIQQAFSTVVSDSTQKPAFQPSVSPEPIRTVMQQAIPRVIVGYRKEWVPGRPLAQCLGPDKELNENVLRCRNGYFRQEPIYSK
jgi:hypothetical protein